MMSLGKRKYSQVQYGVGSGFGSPKERFRIVCLVR